MGTDICAYYKTKPILHTRKDEYILTRKPIDMFRIQSSWIDSDINSWPDCLHLFTFQTPILTAKKIKKCKINSRNFTYDGLTFSSSGFSLWEEEVKDEI